jgi:hypothetical protein
MAYVVRPHSWDEVPIVAASGQRDELLAVDSDLIIDRFTTHGVVLFRSFTIGIERYQALVRGYSQERIRYPGVSRAAVSKDGKIQTVKASVDAIPLRSELSHTPFRPDIC